MNFSVSRGFSRNPERVKEKGVAIIVCFHETGRFLKDFSFFKNQKDHTGNKLALFQNSALFLQRLITRGMIVVLYLQVTGRLK